MEYRKFEKMENSQNPKSLKIEKFENSSRNEKIENWISRKKSWRNIEKIEEKKMKNTKKIVKFSLTMKSSILCCSGQVRKATFRHNESSFLDLLDSKVQIELSHHLLRHYILAAIRYVWLWNLSMLFFLNFVHFWNFHEHFVRQISRLDWLFSGQPWQKLHL